MPVPPTTMLNDTFGTLLIATWANMLLLGLEISEFARYYSSSAYWICAYVILMVCSDVVCMYGGCGAAYTYLIVGWGDLSIAATVSINYAIYLASLVVGVGMLHAFLIRRYLLLSRNRVFSGFLAVPALTALIGGLVVSSDAATKLKLWSDRPRERTMVMVWCISSVVADAMIAAAMMHQLHSIRVPNNRTNGLIRRLMRNTILSGAAPGILALLSVLMYQLFPFANTTLVFTLNISRAGTLTVLYNLNDPHSADLRFVGLANSQDAPESKCHPV